MAFHTAGLIAKIGDLNPRGEDHAGLVDSRVVVAGRAFYRAADRMRCIDDTGFAAICAQEINVSTGAVSLGAALRNLRWVIFVPVVERFSSDVVVW